MMQNQDHSPSKYTKLDKKNFETSATGFPDSSLSRFSFSHFKFIQSKLIYLKEYMLPKDVEILAKNRNYGNCGPTTFEST